MAARKEEMTLVSDEMKLLFAELGDELERRGFSQPVRILLVGGAFMLLHRYREATHDVDCVLLDLDDMFRGDAQPETKKFMTAVRAVARKMNIHREWLNDDAAVFVRDLAAREPMTHWETFNKLEIYLPSEKCILANKLLSFREKDINDILTLCRSLQVNTMEQAQEILDFYAPKSWQEENDVEIALLVMFPDGTLLTDEDM